jgi:hypothetical protein
MKSQNKIQMKQFLVIFFKCNWESEGLEIEYMKKWGGE